MFSISGKIKGEKVYGIAANVNYKLSLDFSENLLILDLDFHAIILIIFFFFCD